jgi:hypothetical protein
MGGGGLCYTTSHASKTAVSRLDHQAIGPNLNISPG